VSPTGIEEKRVRFSRLLTVLLLLVIIAGSVALVALDRHVPVFELTALGKALVIAIGVVGAVAMLVFLSVKSTSGSNFEELTYARQTKHKSWLRGLLATSLLAGVVSSLVGYQLMGQLIQRIPAEQYSSVRARVIERTSGDGDLYECGTEVEVEAGDATRFVMCLEKGFVWRSVPLQLTRVVAGDYVIVNVRRTAFGSIAEIAEVAKPGQNFYVE
jgi:hypothetical protein